MTDEWLQLTSTDVEKDVGKNIERIFNECPDSVENKKYY